MLVHPSMRRMARFAIVVLCCASTLCSFAQIQQGPVIFGSETGPGGVYIDAGGMTFDTEGFLYVATSLGVQVCDQPGRVTTIINPPGSESVSDVFFGGPNMQWLYVTDGERIYRRRVKRQGATAWTPVKPPQPRL